MSRTRSIERISIVPAAPDVVWDRVVTPEGINHEMRPWMTMSMPRGVTGLTVDSIEVGAPLGKAWLRLFGLVPFDYDHLTIAELIPGEYFHEKSTMLAFRRWEHQRRIQPAGSGTVVTDTITFEPRLPFPGLGALSTLILRAFFGHRHRRLVSYFQSRTVTP